MMDFSELELMKFGNSSMLAGVIYTGEPNVILWLPGEAREPKDMGLDMVAMSNEDWKAFLKQTDDVNTEVSIGDKKAIFRKCLRAIDQNISWQVYARDGFACRYCGRSGIPLTVDHIDLWEKGGITVKENLLSACKKCNKNRGNMAYGDWLNCPEYIIVSSGITEEKREANRQVLTTIPHLETLRVKEIKSR